MDIHACYIASFSIWGKASIHPCHNRDWFLRKVCVEGSVVRHVVSFPGFFWCGSKTLQANYHLMVLRTITSWENIYSFFKSHERQQWLGWGRGLQTSFEQETERAWRLNPRCSVVWFEVIFYNYLQNQLFMNKMTVFTIFEFYFKESVIVKL